MNYKDIVDILRTISESSPLIASFEEGENINHNDDLNFPQVFLQHPVSNSYSNINGQGNKDITFTLFILDKQDEDISQVVNQQTKCEIITESILTNLSTILKQGYKGSSITNSSSTALRNGYFQNCVGYVLDVTVSTFVKNSKCDLGDIVLTYPCVSTSTGGGSSTGGDALTLSGQSPSYYLSRANHTGTQLSNTIYDFNTSVSAITESVVNTYNFSNALTLSGQSPSFYLNRSNHTGTQLSNTISDFNTSVSAITESVVNSYNFSNALTLSGQSPSFYLNRANHTGTQLSNTISNFSASTSAITESVVNSYIVQTTGTSLTNLMSQSAVTQAVKDSQFKIHYFYAGGAGTFPYTNQPAALNYWGGGNGRRAVGFVNLAGYTHYRVDAYIAVNGFSGGSAYVGYRTDLNVGDVVPTSLTGWLTLSSDIGLSPINSLQGNEDWVELPVGARANGVSLALLSQGGNGVDDPAFGNISISFK